MGRLRGCGWHGFLVAVAAVELAVVAHQRRADPPDRAPAFLYGDSAFYAMFARSLWQDGDIDLLNQDFPDATTIDERVLARLEGPIGEYALSADGRLTLKQSPVLAAALMPFDVLFGLAGFLVFNLLAITLLLVGLAGLAGGTAVARVGVLAGFALTPLRWWAYNLSPDVALCALIVGGLLAARAGRCGLAGAACGLAVSVKLYAAAVVLPLAPLAVLSAPPGRRGIGLAKLAAAGAVALAPWAGFNAVMFGRPWVSGYEREFRVVGGVGRLADHSSKFTTPVADGLAALVAHPELGLARTFPAWFGWPAAAAVLLTPRFAPRHGRGWVLAAVGVIGTTLLVFARYDGALIGSRYANRYLFPAVVLGFALMAAAAAALTRRWMPDECGMPAAAVGPAGPAATAGRPGG